MKGRNYMKRHFATVVEYRKYPFPDINPFPFTSNDYGKQIRLASYRFPSQSQQPKAVIVNFPGYGLMQPWYSIAAQSLAASGYEFVGYDYKGHGNSEGAQCHISSFEAHMADARNFVVSMKEHYSNLPIVADTDGHHK